MKTTSSRHRAPTAECPIRITLVVLAFAVLGACSGGGGSYGGYARASSENDLSAEDQAEFEVQVEFAECLRDQGIEGFPDPQVGGEGGFLLVGFPFLAAQRDSEPMESGLRGLCARSGRRGPGLRRATPHPRSPRGGSRSCRGATVSAPTARSSASSCARRAPRRSSSSSRMAAPVSTPRRARRTAASTTSGSAKARGERVVSSTSTTSATRSPSTPSSMSPTARPTSSSATPPRSTPRASPSSTRATSTAPPPSTTWRRRFQGRPTSS